MRLGCTRFCLGVVVLGVELIAVLGVLIGVTLCTLLFSPDLRGDLVFARRDCLVSGRADLALLADAERGDLIQFGIVAVLLIL